MLFIPIDFEEHFSLIKYSYIVEKTTIRLEIIATESVFLRQYKELLLIYFLKLSSLISNSSHPVIIN